VAYRDLILRDRPYLYYEFNDWSTVLWDSGPNEIDGTYYANYLQGNPGMIVGPGRSVFCQLSSHISSTTVSSTLASSGYPFSFEFWMDSTYVGGPTITRPAGLDSTGQLSFGILGNYQASNNSGGNVSAGVAGTYSFYCENSGADALAATTVGINLHDGHPHHLVYTRTATSPWTQTIYVDGALNVTAAPTSATGGAATTLILGALSTGDSQPYSGFLDEVAIYQYVLTPAQVRAHWLAGKGQGIDQGAGGLWSPHSGRARR
jgi:hypothetical protein